MIPRILGRQSRASQQITSFSSLKPSTTSMNGVRRFLGGGQRPQSPPRQQDNFGYEPSPIQTTAPLSSSASRNDDGEKDLRAFLKTAFVPTVITKAFVFFFGIQYSRYPGEGYGWGLLAAISFTLFGFVRFLYKQSKSAESD